LGITLKDLKEGTQEHNLTEYTKTDQYEGKYIYNEKAYAQIISGPKIPFLALKLILEPGAKTKIEKDPEGETKFIKWVYVLKGQMDCIVGGQKSSLKKGDCISFNSSLTHCFENPSAKKALCIIIQHPRHF
jgi:mannose-6-phosphate isomerase-like protein (cupin superfamily)